MKKILKVIFVMLIFSLSVTTQAQLCDAIIEDALISMGRNCDGIARNNACYGYNNVSARFTRVLDRGFFTNPSDLADLADIRTITTTALNPVNNTWGVAALKIQADIPESLPGQAVTFVLVGDVSVEEAADPERPESMQAFYFTTGVGSSRCNQAPDALVIQSPAGLTVNLRVNGADIEMGSTLLLRTLPNPPRMQLIAIEGDIVINTTNANDNITRRRITPFFVVEAPLSQLLPLGRDGDAFNRRVIGEWSAPRRITLSELEMLRKLQLIPRNILPDGFNLPETLPTGVCILNPAYDYLYFAQEGDTLTSIASRFGENVNDLINGNCLLNPDVVFIGQLVLVPTPPLMPEIISEPSDDPPPPPPPPPPPSDVDVAIAMTLVGGNNAIANANKGIQITVSNVGVNPATNVVVTDNINALLGAVFANLTLTSPAPTGTYTIGTGTWNIPVLNAGDNFTLQLDGDVRPGFPNTNYNLTASLTSVTETDTNLANNVGAQTFTITPSNMQVNNLTMAIANDGACTLVEAIIAAQTNTASGNAIGECEAGVGANSTIDFTLSGNLNVPTGIYAAALGGMNGFPDITQNITLRTLPGINVTIERTGVANYRFFYVDIGATLIIQPNNAADSIILTGGNEGEGGAVYNRGTFNVNVGTFFNNNSANNGGALFNAGSANLDQPIWQNNTAIDTLGGGAIYNVGTLTVVSSVFNNNTSIAGGAAISHNTTGATTVVTSQFNAQAGAAFYNIGAGNFFIDNSTIDVGVVQIMLNADTNVSMRDTQINSGATPQCDPPGTVTSLGGNGGGDGTCFP